MLSELIGNFMKKGEYLRHMRVFSSVRFPRGYSCVALYQEVVPFSKAMGLVLGSEIVIPEKVCMGRGPLAWNKIYPYGFYREQAAPAVP